MMIDSAVEERLVPMLADLLDRVLKANKNYIPATIIPSLRPFYACREPKISLSDYLDRIYQFSCCSPSCLIVAMVYIERAVLKNSALVLSTMNVHRVVVTAVLLAAKYLEDLHYDNAYWAKIAGITIRELNKLEVTFLKMLEWNLEVGPMMFEQYFFGLLSTQPAAEDGDEEFFDAPEHLVDVDLSDASMGLSAYAHKVRAHQPVCSVQCC